MEEPPVCCLNVAARRLSTRQLRPVPEHRARRYHTGQQGSPHLCWAERKAHVLLFCAHVPLGSRLRQICFKWGGCD